ncbi:dipeptidase PepE [Propionimicrobium sp. PCR01-08-3]|uniref:dipeptidase PepE n=1 Tax=Propionimicrobium sp. PCR01-08-3 TaxID=3052086 RepID=UPI00255C3242|nr:dipeptidase PepE [Propionimicrobium sp. PCR01-08-3]WIY83207.1 dipeptidase PepE [Propionimicrobium sp. PCR01-08-3]
MELLLLSNSTQFGHPMLSHAAEEITAHFPSKKVIFVPFAMADLDGYTAAVSRALEPMEIEITGIHTVDDPGTAIRDAGAVYVGGGNSFRLLKSLQERGLLETISGAVADGAHYMGASAGSNVACPTIRTSNDMPIVQPAGFDALDLIPFQINPHFVSADPASTHMGETREKRIAEFHECNDVTVLGLREGAWLKVSGQQATLGGTTGAVLLDRGKDPILLTTGANLSELLSRTPHFDIA